MTSDTTVTDSALTTSTQNLLILRHMSIEMKFGAMVKKLSSLKNLLIPERFKMG